jgi:hypothetical protein
MLLQPPTQVLFDLVCGEISQPPLGEGLLQMSYRPHIGLVGLGCADRRLGVVLQKKRHPILK